MTSDHPDVRQHIIDTALPIILGKGFSAVGLSELLTEAAVPKGSFYHYFKSKEAFGEALLDSYFADYHERLRARLKAEEGDAAQRLMSYWTMWRETQASDGPIGKCLIVKLAGEVSDLSEAMRTALQRGTDRIIALLAECIDDGVADGSLVAAAAADVDEQATALMLYELWLGASLLTKIRRDPSALDAALATTTTLLARTERP